MAQLLLFIFHTSPEVTGASRGSLGLILQVFGVPSLWSAWLACPLWGLQGRDTLQYPRREQLFCLALLGRWWGCWPFIFLTVEDKGQHTGFCH